MLVPIAFTSDHIETLYELDVEVKEEAEKVGQSQLDSALTAILFLSVDNLRMDENADWLVF